MALGGADGIRETKVCTLSAPFLNSSGPNAPICPDLRFGLPESVVPSRPYAPLPAPLAISINNPDCSFWVNRLSAEAISAGANQGSSESVKCNCFSNCVPADWRQSVPQTCRLDGNHKADVFMNISDTTWVDGDGIHCSTYYNTIHNPNSTQGGCMSGNACPEGFIPLTNSLLEEMIPEPTPGQTPPPATNMCDLYRSLIPAIQQYSAENGNCEWPELNIEQLTSGCNLSGTEQLNRSGVCLP